MTPQEAAKKRADLEEDKAFILTRRAQRKMPVFHANEELNLVPYMDVLVNLIIFLLVTLSTFLPLGMLSIFPLSVATGAIEKPEEKKQELNFSVFITKDGFNLAGVGGMLPPIPKKSDKTYDFDTLAVKTVEVKDAWPKETRVILMAEKDIVYNVIIKTMDTLRNKGERLLFPDVQLSPGLAQGQ